MNKNKQCKNCEEWFHICSQCDDVNINNRVRNLGYCSIECLIYGEVEDEEIKDVISSYIKYLERSNEELKNSLYNLYHNFGCSGQGCNKDRKIKVINEDFCEYHKLLFNILRKINKNYEK